MRPAAAAKLASIAVALVATLVASSSPLRAEASGPDYWNVTGVRTDDVLNMHTAPSARSRTIAGIPPGAKGLRNLGCRGGPTFKQWLAMSDTERVRAGRSRWCRVAYGSDKGWVAARYLVEGSAPGADTRAATYGPWTLRCTPGCTLEQVGIGTTARTLLRLTPRQGVNAEIMIERRGIARKGTFSAYIDGALVTEGPLAPYIATATDRLVMPPDDITAGLLKRMKEGKNLVLSFPGEERGVEIHLDDFAAAWAEANRNSAQ